MWVPWCVSLWLAARENLVNVSERLVTFRARANFQNEHNCGLYWVYRVTILFSKSCTSVFSLVIP